ncbi:MAG: flagellar filament capping protein FliD [Candidatus Omnitrophica bacterium]|nr:flagellar filament capping protein FliD [Candidatus Omnitrophota bacterium]
MSSFSFDGLISGLDTTSLIEAHINLQFGSKIKQYENRIAAETEKLTSLQSISANLLSLRLATSSLNATSMFESKTVLSSNSGIVSASVSSSASEGNFSIRVDNLAQSDQVSTDVFVSQTDELNLSGQFIINGQTIDVSSDDSLMAIASQINASNAGVQASVVQMSANQNKLVIGASSTGVDKIEMREVGGGNILSSLGLLTSNANDLTYDRTVNANNQGALSEVFEPGFTQTYTGETFTVGDAGGQYTISVTLNGADMTLHDIAGAINQASNDAGANISASVIDDDGGERLLITSTTGIPQEFTDPDNILFDLGVLGGIQSAAFSSSSSLVGDLLDLEPVNASTITLEDGDGSDSFSFEIDFTADSLQAIVDRINNQAAAAGSDITAKIITADDVHRIELNSATGQVNILEDSENALQTLGLADRQFKNFDQRGENAQLIYNGITVNRSSNIITDLREGVTLSLVNESDENVNISISKDLSHVEGILEDFVEAYNTLTEFLTDQSFYDRDSGEKGILFGNSLVRDLKSSMSACISRSVFDLPGVNVYDLNNGAGIDMGKIQITNRTGESFTVDLTSVQTLQDVIDEINYTDGIQVRAEINANGTGINLVDESGAAGVFKVEEIGGGSTAADLGVKKQIYSDGITGSRIFEGGTLSLSTIGVSMKSGGTLTFDASKFQAALDEDPDAIKNLIQASDIGLGDYFSNMLNIFTASDGRMDTATQGIQDQIKDYSKQIERYSERADVYSETLRAKYTAMELSLSQSQSMSDMLTQYLGINKDD